MLSIVLLTSTWKRGESYPVIMTIGLKIFDDLDSWCACVGLPDLMVLRLASYFWCTLALDVLIWFIP